MQIRLNLDNNEDAKKQKVNISYFNKPGLPQPTEVYDTYWKFAAKRQAIFFSKLKNDLPPWTNDPILSSYKFTNSYRASDRVSQYLIKNVIYQGNPSPRETFFRILLFKIFNKIETWQLLEKEIGPINYASYSFEAYNEVLSTAMKNKKAIYSGAYIMASGKSFFGHSRKHQNHLKLIELMMADDIPLKIKSLKSLEELYQLLRSYPTLGNFLAFQYAIDINYSELTNFSEMDFVVPGPGAKDGIRKCFSSLGNYSEEDIIRMMADRQEQEFERLEIDFMKLWGRPLQLIDCQNLFCEVDKYSRVAHPNIQGISNRKRIKSKYSPKRTKIDYWYPPKWGINTKIKLSPWNI